MPSPDQFHSEFGYMCPTPRFRRILRVTLVAGVAGAMAGAVGVIALAQRADVERMRTEIASTVSSTVGMAVTAAAPTNGPPAPGSVPCAAQSWPYLDNKCLLGTGRNIRTAPDTFAAPAEAAAPSDAHAEASSAKPSQSAAALAKKRPKTAQRRERVPERQPERQDADPRSASVAPLTYDQWRFDNSRFDNGRYDNGAGREPPRERRGLFQ